MTEKLSYISCARFAEQLASKAPTPGGGGAAALAGTLSAALCSMVCNYTVGKKKYAAFEEDIKEILAKADELRLRLLKLIDEDAEAFAPLANAYAMPKDDPDYEWVFESATVNACYAPLEMLMAICETVELLEQTLEKGSVMLVSDTGCAAALCSGALKSAAMNIFVNTKTLKNRDTAEEINHKTNTLLGEYTQRADALADEVMRRLWDGV